MRTPEVVNELLSARVTTHAGSRRVRRVRLLLALGWCGALALTALLHEVPKVQWQILLWLAAAMLIASIANPLGWVKSMALDWFPLYLVLILYNCAWALASHLGLQPHVDPQLWIDKALFGPDGGVDMLQDALWQGHVRNLDYVVWGVYLSHFFVTICVLAILWMKSHESFLQYRRRVIGTWFSALVVFALYPTVPPWMAAEQGHIPALSRVLERLVQGASPKAVQSVAESSSGGIDLYNPVAAVPSMHSALPALLALFLWNRLPLLRPLLVAYPVVMGLALIYTGEHFVFDIVAGWACAALIHGACGRRERRRDAWRESPSAARHNDEPSSLVREPVAP